MALLKHSRAFADAYRNGGLGSAISAVREFTGRRYDQWAGSRFDERFRVDTNGIEHLANFSLVADTVDDATWYEPVAIRVANRVLHDLEPLAAGSVFVDYGSGKGRMLMLASRLNFKRIVGVEFAQELSTIANNNIANFYDPRKRCTDIQSVLCDATEFRLPDDPCVIFLFAPFRGEVLKKVIHNIRSSYHENPRRMHVVYAKPFHGNKFEVEQFLELRVRRSSFGPTFIPTPYRYEIYETL